MNSIDLQTTTNQLVEQNQKETTGIELGKHGLQALTATIANQRVEQIIAQLPQLAKSQMNCVNTLLHPLEDPKQLTQIYDAIDNLKLLLQTPASLSEIDSLINLVFITLPSHNKNEHDIIFEKKSWIKLLEGQPYWAIENACYYVSKNKKWRVLSELIDSVLNETKEIRVKILLLRQLAETTLKHEHTTVNSSTYEEFIKTIENASKNGNYIAKVLLKKN